MLRKYILISILSLLVFLFSCTQESEEPEAVKPVPVTTASVTYEEISQPIQRSGLLATGSEARLSFKIGGIIRQIFVDEGSTVSDGQLLAALNLSEINAQVELARVSYEKAVRDHKRVTNLYRDSVATLEQLQDTKTALDATQANLDIAQFNFQHARILAPANGRILKRFAEENELVGPGSPVFYFGSSDANWIVRFGVTDRELVRLSPGDPAKIVFDAYPDQRFTGSVTEISESVDPKSGTFEVEITLADTDARLVSGFVARVTIHPGQKQWHYLIPVEALVEAEVDSAFIYTVSDTGDQVQKIKVHTGPILGNRVIILSNLKDIDKVIVAGNAYLTGESIINQVNTE